MYAYVRERRNRSQKSNLGRQSEASIIPQAIKPKRKDYLCFIILMCSPLLRKSVNPHVIPNPHFFHLRITKINKKMEECIGNLPLALYSSNLIWEIWISAYSYLMRHYVWCRRPARRSKCNLGLMGKTTRKPDLFKGLKGGVTPQPYPSTPNELLLRFNSFCHFPRFQYGWETFWKTLESTSLPMVDDVTTTSDGAFTDHTTQWHSDAYFSQTVSIWQVLIWLADWTHLLGVGHTVFISLLGNGCVYDVDTTRAFEDEVIFESHL